MGKRRLAIQRDEDLLARAADGDVEAFGVFYDRHFGSVLAFVRGRVRDGELAFDLTAETFARMLASLSRFDERKGSALSWAFTIARNLLVDAYRTREVSDETRRRLGMEPLDLWDRDLERLERVCLNQQATLAAGLAGLPPEQAAAVVARVIDEHAYEDIARELRCSPSVVRQRVSRGLRTLRAGLKEHR
ncbi:RNA polymerase sigma factor [Paraconexibacter algicola]|uniref:RNA polymerase sigma factor n=1 Tax=Paraconexibacter algicola TaxID=2133960 RepID=UPI001304B18C|nr:RNA polymerase sigma factor [Paraconexibacter algicola]